MYNGNIRRSSIVEMLILAPPATVPHLLALLLERSIGGSCAPASCVLSLSPAFSNLLLLLGGRRGGRHTPTRHRHANQFPTTTSHTRATETGRRKTSQESQARLLHSTPDTNPPSCLSMTKIISLLAAMAVVVKPTSAFVPSPSSSDARIASSATRTYASKNDDDDLVTDRRSAVFGLAGLAISPFVVLPPSPANARLEGVNKPELLPSEPGLNVIQVEKFLTKGQEKRVNEMLTSLEKDTGFRVKLLCQAYPRTPGERFVIAI